MKDDARLIELSSTLSKEEFNLVLDIFAEHGYDEAERMIHKLWEKDCFENKQST